MANKKFEVGDEVQCIQAGEVGKRKIKAGFKYTVAQVDKAGDVRLKGGTIFWKAGRFMKAEEVTALVAAKKEEAAARTGAGEIPLAATVRGALPKQGFADLPFGTNVRTRPTREDLE